jgi:UDP-4-amino-4,6-dideoxy-N-acetyl-beta-L-altrosamine transaminase
MAFNIPYGRQHITDDDTRAVVEALHSDFLTQGPRIAEFEKNFAEYTGSRYAVAVSNGTAALHLALLAAGIGEGDRVITTPITFAASANAALYCGAEVHFVDIDPLTHVMSAAKLKALIDSHPKNHFSAVIPVDFTGFPVNLEEIREICQAHQMFILEDACHAPGGYFVDSKGEKQPCGSCNYADAAVFSFHPVKHIAAGEGGLVTTNDDVLYNKLMLLRTHGITKENLQLDFPQAENQGAWYYEMQTLGYNYRITEMQAALANSQLKRADEGLKRRQEIAGNYRRAFAGTGIVMQAESEKHFHAYHLFVIEVNNRKGLYDHLQKNGVFAQIHYIPVHLMPYYRKLGFKPGDFPDAEAYYSRCISLPMYPTLTSEEQNHVIAKTLEFYGR